MILTCDMVKCWKEFCSQRFIVTDEDVNSHRSHENYRSSLETQLGTFTMIFIDLENDSGRILNDH